MDIYNPFILFDPVFIKESLNSYGLYVCCILFGSKLFIMILPLVVLYRLCLIAITYFPGKK